MPRSHQCLWYFGACFDAVLTAISAYLLAQTQEWPLLILPLCILCSSITVSLPYWTDRLTAILFLDIPWFLVIQCAIQHTSPHIRALTTNLLGIPFIVKLFVNVPFAVLHCHTSRSYQSLY